MLIMSATVVTYEVGVEVDPGTKHFRVEKRVSEL